MSRERQTEIREDGAPHTWRTEIPNSVVRGLWGQGLSLQAKWLYVYLKSVAGDTQECFQGARMIARGAGMGVASVHRAKKELVTKGLIVLTPGSTLTNTTDRIRIKNIWVSNIQEFHDSDPIGIRGTSSEATVDTEEPSIHDPIGITPDPIGITPDPIGITPDPIGITRRSLLRRSQEEEEGTPLPPQPARRAKGVASKRCPESFEPDATTIAYAAENYPQVDFQEALDAMRDWEFKDAKTDWNATLRGWVRTEAKRGPGGGSTGRRLTRAEELKAANDLSNKQMEDIALGRNTRRSVWDPVDQPDAHLSPPAGGRRQGRLSPGAE